MIFSRSLVLVASLVRLVHGQAWTAVNISNIDQATRDQWCLEQRSSCPLICLQLANTTDTPILNDCYSDDLTYDCVCSNNMSPNTSEYSLTIPYFLCTQQNNDCVNSCSSSDSTCQSDCRSEHPCGAQDPQRVNATNATSTPTTVTAAATSSLAAFTGEPKSGMAARSLSVEMQQVYGLCLLVGGFIAGFATLL